MTYHDDKTPNAAKRPGSERPRTDRAGWGIPLGIAAIVFVAATIIFSSAGPDRTRTASTPAMTSPGPTTSESAPAQTPTPARPNASGTQ